VEAIPLLLATTNITRHKVLQQAHAAGTPSADSHQTPNRCLVPVHLQHPMLAQLLSVIFSVVQRHIHARDGLPLLSQAPNAKVMFTPLPVRCPGTPCSQQSQGLGE
jgi:hypothetical protein